MSERYKWTSPDELEVIRDGGYLEDYDAGLIEVSKEGIDESSDEEVEE